MELKQVTELNVHMLFDANSITKLPADFFILGSGHEKTILHYTQGRNVVAIFSWHGEEYVLRHYHRGGLMATVNNDYYLWRGLEQTRPWREWFLLSTMYQQGLPTPRPIAARVVRYGLFYTADLITQRLPQVTTLADILMSGAVSTTWWHEIGLTIQRFHQAGIYHADLNARNILLNHHGQVFIIDFDKSDQRIPKLTWQHANLQRLQRSLCKCKKNKPYFGFDEQCWQWLLDGYNNLI